MATARLASSLLLVATLLACQGPTSDPVIDGWSIGVERDCTPDRDCPLLLATAEATLDRRDPGHPAIVAAVLHAEGRVVNVESGIILNVRSGACCDVAVFELADGSSAAIGVGYPGISRVPIAFDYGMAP